MEVGQSRIAAMVGFGFGWRLRDNRSGYVIPRGAAVEGDENERRNYNCGITERVPSTYRPLHSPLENKKHCTHHERTKYVQGGMRAKSPM